MFSFQIATSSRKTATKKEDEDADDSAPGKVKKDEDSGDDSNADDNEKEMHDIDVRDVKYKMEILGDWIQNSEHWVWCSRMFSSHTLGGENPASPRVPEKALKLLV